MAKVTYNTIYDGDPHHTEMGGRQFKAGEAVEFDTQHAKDKHHPLHKAHAENAARVEQAKGNPWFTVEGHERAEEQGVPENPTTPEEYRRYAIDWISSAPSFRALNRRWDKESDMRDGLGWGTDDQNLLDPILEPRREQLKRGE